MKLVNHFSFFNEPENFIALHFLVTLCSSWGLHNSVSSENFNNSKIIYVLLCYAVAILVVGTTLRDSFLNLIAELIYTNRYPFK